MKKTISSFNFITHNDNRNLHFYYGTFTSGVSLVCTFKGLKELFGKPLSKKIPGYEEEIFWIIQIEEEVISISIVNSNLIEIIPADQLHIYSYNYIHHFNNELYSSLKRELYKNYTAQKLLEVKKIEEDYWM